MTKILVHCDGYARDCTIDVLDKFVNQGTSLLKIAKRYLNWLEEKNTTVTCSVVDDFGNRNGASETYDCHGKLMLRIFYDKNVPNGVAKSWYPNGKPKSEYKYKNGWLDGACKAFNPDGSFKSECFYIKGKQISITEWGQKKAAISNIIGGLQTRKR